MTLVLAPITGAAEAPVALPAATPTVVAPAAAPLAPVRPISETFFGTTVTDPYRYLEEVKTPEVDAFLRAQSSHARQVLDSLPGRSKLQSRIDALSGAGGAISGVQLSGAAANPRTFYYRLAPGGAAPRLYVRDGFKGVERLVFDPAALSPPEPRRAIDFFRASPDGRYVIVGIAAGGSAQTALRILEVGRKDARDSGVEIDRIGFAAETHWATDSRSFFYNRLPPPKGSHTNHWQDSRVYRHVIGRAATRDEPVFGGDLSDVKFADIDVPGVRLAADGRTLIGTIRHGAARELSLYTASAGELGGKIKWRAALLPKDQVTDFVVAGNVLYLLTHHNAPRFKVLRTSLLRAEFALATTIVPQGDTVLSQIEVAQDGLYIRELFGGVDRLQRLNFSHAVFSGGQLEFVRLPFDLAIRQIIASPSRPGVVLRLESWTEAPKYVMVEERSANLSDSGLQPPSAADFSDIVELRQMATARDGTMIPLSLIYRKTTTLNADNPTLLHTYGAHGQVQAPTFNPSTLAWIERGGILATCHVRGGGEFGDPWHRAGQKLTKPNSWRDLIACAEFLIERKFTRPARLALHGAGAGAISVGRALTERPELFAAVIVSGGIQDTLRMEFTPNGAPNVGEFGSVTTEDGFKGLLEMSAYHQLKDQVTYPAVLLTHGIDDPRVEVWHSAKMGARLQALREQNLSADRPANPVLLRQDGNAELADIYSFLLWRFGDPTFQP